MNQRRSLSKRKRFEIFKRDSFTCQYCGGKPPDVILHVDHIHPVADGGTNDDLNLVSACADCNGGKGRRALDDKAVRPDAEIATLAVHQECEEIKAFIAAQHERQRLEVMAIESLGQHWNRYLNDVDPGYRPSDETFLRWMAVYDLDEIAEAIRLTSPKARYFRRMLDAVKYVSGILRTRKDRGMVA